jgi:hypothetical protein
MLILVPDYGTTAVLKSNHLHFKAQELKEDISYMLIMEQSVQCSEL